MALGFDENEFWHRTPAQVDRAMAARNEILIREHNQRAWLAWHIAALSRMKKIPDMKRLMAQAPKKPQTWQEQLKIAHMWAGARMGKIIPANQG